MNPFKKPTVVKIITSRTLDEGQITGALGGVSAEHTLWMALNQIIANQVEDETLALLAPNLGDSAAHFNRGRVAALKDLQGILEQAREKAQRRQ